MARTFFTGGWLAMVTDRWASFHGGTHVSATSVLTHDDVTRRPERLGDDGAADLGIVGDKC